MKKNEKKTFLNGLQKKRKIFLRMTKTKQIKTKSKQNQNKFVYCEF